MTLDIGRILQQLEARIARVERSARLSHASLDNASIVVTDGTGAVRGRIGMQPDGTIGLIAQDGPPPGAPSVPVVVPSIGGLRVVWDGTLADGSTLPSDFDHIAVHVSTSSGFTPSAATFVGTITRSGEGGMLPVTPLPYDAHYVVLIAVNSSGIGGPASAETAATPVQVTGPDLTAGSVTAAKIQAGAVQADKLEAVLQLVTRIVAGDPDGARVELNEDGLRVYNSSDELVIQFDSATGDAVFTGTIEGSVITGGSLTGTEIQTAASGERITLNEADANKILVYDASRAVAELSALGLALVGTGGALMVLDPNATYPNIRLTNAGQTNDAVINVVETNTGNADLGLNSGIFSGSGHTDMKWRTFLGGDFAVVERLREGDTGVVIGGRIHLLHNTASFGYLDTTGATRNADTIYSPGLAMTRARALIQPGVGDSSTLLFLQPGPSHTGPILRYFDPDASVYRFALDKAGNVDINGILTAGNVAAGRITITPSGANVPTSGNVTGLNLKGTNIRVVATAVSTGPGTVVTGVSTTGSSATGFTIWVTRANTTGSTSVEWIAYGTP
ncbi:hypothetical protein ACIP2X_37815 [Streptomyces sp. NPDC089424]|uniref:hypothetical protein n=1 Tax=Streptomyces sp. NPDC089424 TaxID=3365917 RepID=UPI00380A7B47